MRQIRLALRVASFGAVQVGNQVRDGTAVLESIGHIVGSLGRLLAARLEGTDEQRRGHHLQRTAPRPQQCRSIRLRRFKRHRFSFACQDLGQQKCTLRFGRQGEG